MKNKCFPFCFDSYVSKVNYRLGQEDADIKRKTFEEILETNGSNVEEVYQIQDKDIILAQTKCIIRDHKINLDYDEKYLLTPLAIDTKVGDIFYWPRTNTHWIVYAKYLTEKSYHKTIIKRANWYISWNNVFGKTINQWVYVRGPVETKIDSNTIKNKVVDKLNWTLSIQMPNTKETQVFKKYDCIMLNKKKWEITVVDDITTKDIIELQLNQVGVGATDDITNNIVEGNLIPDFNLQPLFNNELPLNFTLDVNKQIIFTKDGEKGDNDFKIQKIKGEATVKDSKITFTEVGQCEFKVTHKQNSLITQTFIVDITNNVENVYTHKIEGINIVKTLFAYKYTTQIYNLSDKYEWKIIDEKNIVKEYNVQENEINIRFSLKTGKIKLELYVNNEFKDAIDIKVLSTFE